MGRKDMFKIPNLYYEERQLLKEVKKESNTDTEGEKEDE